MIELIREDQLPRLAILNGFVRVGGLWSVAVDKGKGADVGDLAGRTEISSGQGFNSLDTAQIVRAVGRVDLGKIVGYNGIDAAAGQPRFFEHSQ